MVKKSIDAKVRPLANASLEKTSLLGAARLYVSKDSLIALTNGLESNKPCVVEKILDGSATPNADEPNGPIRREASLCVLPEKNLSPNVVMMTRAFQDATGFRVGDQVRIALLEATPDVDEVVVRDVSEAEAGAAPQLYPLDWRPTISISMDRAEQIFPGMIFEGVAINKLRRNFKVVRVNGQGHNLGRFRLATSTIRILQADEDDNAAASSSAADAGGTPGGDLVVTGVPGLANQIAVLNRFLGGFGRPFWVADERESCAFVLHGGHGTGKTFILQRLAASGWAAAAVHWIKPSDKLSTVREVFRQAVSVQPSMVFLDGLEELVSKERPNRDAVIETIGDELDALSAKAKAANRLPNVVVVATCLDYMLDVPAKLQKRARLRDNVALPIPRAPERREILDFLNPPLREAEREACLANIASRTHAYNGDDLANLVLNAKRILGNRLDAERKPAAVEDEEEEGKDRREEQFLAATDMEQALRVTRPTAMHDINLNPPTIHWNDVGGQDKLKKVLSRMIKNTKTYAHTMYPQDTNPASQRVLRNPPKGLLLYGPPGCSKTLSAQAMATESSFNFFAVKGAELLNMYVGESERAVRTLFERARAASPSIIFFDEIDSIGGQRTPGGAGGGGSASRSNGSVNMLTTLLTEMDGFESLTGVLVLAATNRPEAMDPALLRPGRFDQVVYVGPPDAAAREAIFAVHLRGLTLAGDVDVGELARLADGYSGAEIKAICNEAGLAVLDRFDDTDGAAPLEIGMEDLKAAMDRTPRNITKFMTDSYESWSKQFKRA
ncbi:hypothetical protein PWT90_01139 [Aphanocladium album]|nr:hypothetical protein PWT90_01139 [Aphanocladium album]